MKTFILDSQDVPHTEGLAVLQALYSRSLTSIVDQVPTVTQDRSNAFINKYVVGYNHDSILDSTNTLIAFEGVSMLTAKAVQDHPLYKGTECSTRYIDFSSQPFINPFEFDAQKNRMNELEYSSYYYEGNALFAKLRSFYTTNLPRLCEHFKGLFPREEGQSETVYLNAIKARAFDVMRGFLPAGATTNLSWVGSINTLNARALELKYHELQEIRLAGQAVVEHLGKKYPASARAGFAREEIDAFLNKHSQEYSYGDINATLSSLDEYVEYCYGDDRTHNAANNIYYGDKDIEVARDQFAWLADRPRGAPVPRMPGHPGIELIQAIDFGSFRDIQRHRNCVQRIPILTTHLGFHPWYLENLPDDIRAGVQPLLDAVVDFVSSIDDYRAQYFIPMGFTVANNISMSIPQAVYMAELRSSRHVHPTARQTGLDLATFLEDKYPFIKIYPDRDTGVWNIKRGEQDITTKD